MDLVQFRQDIQLELKELLSWWTSNMVDHGYGGFYGRMSGGGVLYPEAEKGIILNTRLLWTFSSAAISLDHDTDLIQMATRSFRYLKKYFYDHKLGGFYWNLDYQGQVVDGTKQIYAQAFAIYALCAYYDLTNDADALKIAWDTVERIERFSRDQKKEGYFNVCDRTWNVLEDVALSEKDEPAAKIMNTHLHVLEAYTKLYLTDPKPTNEKLLNYILEIYGNNIYDANSNHCIIYLNEDWIPLTKEISFGHDIESSWLMMEAAESLGNAKIIHTISDIALALASITLEEGRDQEGGIFEKTDPEGKEIEKNKHWWPQAEAVVGFLNAYQISGEHNYMEAALTSWQFIKKYFRDHENGEWHWMINEKGAPVLSEDKAGPWKAPYHNVRMCLEVLKRLNRLP
jgi:mannobiose 2-epimerase